MGGNVDSVIKNALLEAMDEFHRICEENGLKYFLIGGSLIGAIRHKGCIPWDDDLDVIMLKDDFTQLLKLKDQFKHGFKLRHHKLDYLEPEPIARLENQSVVIDEGYYSGVLNGAFIDVFCFEKIFKNKVLQTAHFKASTFSRVLIRLKTKSYRQKKYPTSVFNTFRALSILLTIFPKKLLNLFLSITDSIGALSNSGYIANLHGAWKTKEIAHKKLFEERKLYEFEGRYYWSIADADAWLIPIYGDYMQLPSVKDRQPKHIDKIISIDGVKQ